MGYYFWLAARDILYVPSHRQDNTYHSFCYTSRGSLARTRNISMGSHWRMDPTTHRTMSERSYHGATWVFKGPMGRYKPTIHSSFSNVGMLLTSNRVATNYYHTVLDTVKCIRSKCNEMWLVHICDSEREPLSYFSFQSVLHDWCNKAVVCVILSVPWCIYI